MEWFRLDFEFNNILYHNLIVVESIIVLEWGNINKYFQVQIFLLLAFFNAELIFVFLNDHQLFQYNLLLHQFD